jgi:hypothetical protein
VASCRARHVVSSSDVGNGGGTKRKVGNADLWSQPPSGNKHENGRKTFKIKFGPPPKSALVCTASSARRLGPYIARAPQPTTGALYPAESPAPFTLRIEMPRHVWLCTRPLAYEIPGMDITSDPGRFYLRHWGVLVSELAVVDVQVLIESIGSPNIRNEVIGTIYQLMQYNNQPDLFVDSKTTIEMIKSEWKSIHVQYVGDTLLTHEMIMTEGMPPTHQLAFLTALQLPSFLRLTPIIALSTTTVRILPHICSRPCVQESQFLTRSQKYSRG